MWDLLYDVVMDGDVTAVDALDAALPRPQQIELRDLKSGALSGQWPPSMTEDRGLWLLMAALWRPKGLVDAGYLGEDPEEPMVFFHLWNGSTTAAKSTWHELDEPILLAVRFADTPFDEALTFTPEGQRRRPEPGSLSG